MRVGRRGGDWGGRRRGVIEGSWEGVVVRRLDDDPRRDSWSFDDGKLHEQRRRGAEAAGEEESAASGSMARKFCAGDGMDKTEAATTLDRFFPPVVLLAVEAG